jgi:cytochrome c biogenesis protein CcdA
MGLVGWTRRPSLFGLELLDKELELRRSGVGQLSESGRDVWQTDFLGWLVAVIWWPCIFKKLKSD